jgi:hypothetical protein
MERLTTEDFIARFPISDRCVDDARHHHSAITAEWLNAQNSFCASVGLNLLAEVLTYRQEKILCCFVPTRKQIGGDRYADSERISTACS